VFIPIFDRPKSFLTAPYMTFCLPYVVDACAFYHPDILKLRSELSLVRDIRLKW
jgi:hypothetical protein